MTKRYYLAEALEHSSERAAFRMAPFHDVWEVRVEICESPYTLIHHLSANGEPGDPLKHIPIYYRTLEDLLEDQDKRDEAVLGLSDWYSVNEETQNLLTSLIGTYSTPGYWPPS